MSKGTVQIFVDHRQFADKEALPIDWTMMYPRVSWSQELDAYLVEKDLGGGTTSFILPKGELERAFR